MGLTELEQYLVTKNAADLKRYAAHLLAADTERPLLLTAHAVVEQLLGDMISTRLSHPEIWLAEADFRSKANLARALGLIADRELNICRVLNSARNSAAHGLDPLPDKWRTEIMRHAFGQDAPTKGAVPEAMLHALQELLARLAAPWMYAKVGKARHELLDQHSNRWQHLMAERLRTHPDPDRAILEDDERLRLSREVDDALAAELRAKDAAK